MSVGAEGELACPGCERTYHARMGHLFLVSDPRDATLVVTEAAPGRHRAGRPTATTS